MKLTSFGLKNFAIIIVLITTLHVYGQNSKAKADVTKVEQIINQMSLRQKVGQLFIFGYRGKESNSTLKRIINDLKPGAIISFKRNIRNATQVAKLNASAQALAIQSTQLPLFVMVDQEGGDVVRIKTSPNPPSALSIGATNNPGVAEAVGDITGRVLRILGFTTNLAPVADLSDPYEKNFIGNRSFGQNPHIVKKMVERFSNGLIRQDIIPTIKHFPGHGGLVQDSHRVLPKKEASLTELEESDLIPFQYISDKSMDSSMMIAHVAYPKLDPTGTPATFSKPIITDLLKNKMGYKGLIITDDLEMMGASSAGTIGERAVKSIQAGSDMVMIAWRQKYQRAAIEKVITAVQDKKISMERIHESLRKIISLKLKHINPDDVQRVDLQQVRKEIKESVRELKDVSQKISRYNVAQALRGYSYFEGTIPKDKLLVVFSADDRFYKVAQKAVPNNFRFYRMKRRQYNRVAETIRKYPNALFFYYVTGSGTARKLNTLKKSEKSKMVVVNSAYPGLIKNTSHFKAVINVNTANHYVGAWLAKYLIEKPEITRIPAEN